MQSSLDHIPGLHEAAGAGPAAAGPAGGSGECEAVGVFVIVCGAHLFWLEYLLTRS